MLEARSLTKYYSQTAAVRQVSFTIKPGEILGYLGPNGAGKSTTVKMLTGLIEPSEGQIFYLGRSVYEDCRGLPLDENDLWMAATALALSAILVSRDSDFQGIEGLSVVAP
jgi:ABC-type uncharacterized transport system ATPase subunit